MSRDELPRLQKEQDVSLQAKKCHPKLYAKKKKKEALLVISRVARGLGDSRALVHPRLLHSLAVVLWGRHLVVAGAEEAGVLHQVPAENRGVDVCERAPTPGHQSR